MEEKQIVQIVAKMRTIDQVYNEGFSDIKAQLAEWGIKAINPKGEDGSIKTGCMLDVTKPNDIAYIEVLQKLQQLGALTPEQP